MQPHVRNILLTGAMLGVTACVSDETQQVIDSRVTAVMAPTGGAITPQARLARAAKFGFDMTGDGRVTSFDCNLLSRQAKLGFAQSARTAQNIRDILAQNTLNSGQFDKTCLDPVINPPKQDNTNNAVAADDNNASQTTGGGQGSGGGF